MSTADSFKNLEYILSAEARNSIDEKRAALKDIFDAEMPQRLLEKAKCAITAIL